MKVFYPFFPHKKRVDFSTLEYSFSSFCLPVRSFKKGLIAKRQLCHIFPAARPFACARKVFRFLRSTAFQMLRGNCLKRVQRLLRSSEPGSDCVLHSRSRIQG